MTDKSTFASLRRQVFKARNIYNQSWHDFDQPTDAAAFFMEQSKEPQLAKETFILIGISEEAALILIGRKGPNLASSLRKDIETKSLHCLLTTTTDPISQLSAAEKWDLLYLTAFMQWRGIFCFAHLNLAVYNSFRQLVAALPQTLIDWYEQVLVPSLIVEKWILGGGVKHTGYNDMGPVPAIYDKARTISPIYISEAQETTFNSDDGVLCPIERIWAKRSHDAMAVALSKMQPPPPRKRPKTDCSIK
jgi:hypothetical protein